MIIIKTFSLFLIIAISSLIGRILSQKYVNRLEELEELKNALNIFKSKIKFTYDPISEIFEEISKNTSKNISNIFLNAKKNMNGKIASIAWENAVDETDCNLNNEDKKTIKTLSKLLGQTDIEGQVSQIEITQNFLEKQIKVAKEEKEKNEKLYKKLGTIIGLAIAIVLI